MMSRAGMHALLAQSGTELSPWLLVAAAGAVVLIILLLASALLRGRRSDTSASQSSAALAPIKTSPAPTASGEHRALERDIQILIKELADLTRRVNAQIAQVDERSARLEQLLRAADERATRLRAIQGEPNGDGNGDGDGIAGVLGVAAAAEPTAAAQPAVAAASSPDEIDPRHVEIYTLCEQGLSMQQIADRLHRPSGEVELIIALRPRNHAMGATRE
jgi:hypothetical protein